MTTMIVILGLACVAWAMAAGLRAIGYCQKHGESVNVAFLGLEMVRCLGRYRTLSRAESGHVGPLFYHYVIPINVALLMALTLLLVHVL